MHEQRLISNLRQKFKTSHCKKRDYMSVCFKRYCIKDYTNEAETIAKLICAIRPSKRKNEMVIYVNDFRILNLKDSELREKKNQEGR